MAGHFILWGLEKKCISLSYVIPVILSEGLHWRVCRRITCAGDVPQRMLQLNHG